MNGRFAMKGSDESDRRFERLLDAWMDLGSKAAPDRVAAAASYEARVTRQAAGLSGWLAVRFPSINMATTIGLAGAAILAMALIGFALLPRTNTGQGPMLTPSPTPRQLPVDFEELQPGRYALADGFPVIVTFDVPDGWRACSFNPVEQVVCRTETEAGISFSIIEDVRVDPCEPNPRRAPPVGPSVDDLVAAIRSIRGFEATSPIDITVDGFRGKQFNVVAPSNPGCEAQTWATAQRTNGVGNGETNEIRIVDVDGVRVMIAIAYFPDEPAEGLGEMHAIVDSIRIGR